MDETPHGKREAESRHASERLNQECFCVTLDPEALCRALEQEVEDPAFCDQFVKNRPNLFSSTPLFLAHSHMRRMVRIVHAIEAVARLQPYREAVLSWAPETAQLDLGPRGVFMGYDFHITPDGPKLIEINTNAGGAFLNALLARAQRACCAGVNVAPGASVVDGFEANVLHMFRSEWRLQRGAGAPQRIAIVDDQPEQQYLYPEFVLARSLFRKAGTDAVIIDAAKLRYEHGCLLAEDAPIDLVYNRLVDFALESPEHQALREAYLDDAVVVTPNPRVHALFADKRNLTVLSDTAAIRGWGAGAAIISDLSGIPPTILVTSENATQLWNDRKRFFFKPAAGYGSKAAYRGDKLTKRVWSEIVQDRFVAQQYAAPAERKIRLDGSSQSQKADVRLYVYAGQVLLSAARLYQGQTTNFRTPGGGFAPVFTV